MNLHCLRQIERMTKRKQYSSDVRDENGRLEDRSERARQPRRLAFPFFAGRS